MMSSCLVNSVLEKLKGLVTMNENLKKQEQEFRTHCRVSAHTHTRTYFHHIPLPPPSQTSGLDPGLVLTSSVCLQEEMVRLQQNIEELKAASGQDDGEEKVPSPLPLCL